MVSGRGLPDGVAKADLVAAHGKKRPRHPRHLRRCHRPVIGAIGHARDIAAHRQPRRPCRLGHRGEALQTFGDARVDIGAGKPFRGRPEDRHLIGLGRQRALKPLHVGRQRRIAHARRAPDPRQHRGAVGHLRHPFGADETGHLDPAEPCPAQAIDQRDLLVPSGWRAFRSATRRAGRPRRSRPARSWPRPLFILPQILMVPPPPPVPTPGRRAACRSAAGRAWAGPRGTRRDR